MRVSNQEEFKIEVNKLEEKYGHSVRMHQKNDLVIAEFSDEDKVEIHLLDL